MLQSTKRRREKYSKLICFGCRARRIRCLLPDTDIQPSSEPQPTGKACHRCQQNGFDCIVDHTTLGRPAQKRNHVDQASNVQQTTGPSEQHPPSGQIEDINDENVGDFLLTRARRKDGGPDDARARPSKSEIVQAMISPFHLLSALLSRDKHFATSIVPKQVPAGSILDVVNDHLTVLLDRHLVWHRLYYPDIPSLPNLRQEIKSMERGQLELTSRLYLLTLLYELALDTPSAELSAYQHLQPVVRASLFHYGQQMLFSLPRCKNTVLALIITAEYRPLALTSSQEAGASTIKAVPYTILGKFIAQELGYSTMGARLMESLESPGATIDELTILTRNCIQWIRLSLEQDAISASSARDFYRIREFDPSTSECLEALRTAAMFNRIPTELLTAYNSVSCYVQCLESLRKIFANWRDLDHLATIITDHSAFCKRSKESVERSLEHFSIDHPEKANAISHCAEMERHLYYTLINGTALFYAVMSAALVVSVHRAVEADDAIEVSDYIIDQLKAHHEGDPDRPSNRKFLETFGPGHDDQLAGVLSNFITAADSLTLDGIPYVGPKRRTGAWLNYYSKEICEGNAARFKGWGGLHERVGVQMILFSECARRLEGMSSSAGSEEALSRGCLLTATAKLIRGLHRIMQGWKRDVATNQRRSASQSTKTDPTPPSALADTSAVPDFVDSSAWDRIVTDDLFADWDNWPSFDAFDFSDLFGDAVAWGGH